MAGITIELIEDIEMSHSSSEELEVERWACVRPEDSSSPITESSMLQQTSMPLATAETDSSATESQTSSSEVVRRRKNSFNQVIWEKCSACQDRQQRVMEHAATATESDWETVQDPASEDSEDCYDSEDFEHISDDEWSLLCCLWCRMNKVEAELAYLQGWTERHSAERRLERLEQVMFEQEEDDGDESEYPETETECSCLVGEKDDLGKDNHREYDKETLPWPSCESMARIMIESMQRRRETERKWGIQRGKRGRLVRSICEAFSRHYWGKGVVDGDM